MDFVVTHQEKIRYLLVGFWNTIFGFLIFSIAYELFHKKCNYLVLNLLCSEIAILNAYVGYKYFVFQTRNAGIIEIIRFHLTYLIGLALSTMLLWIFVSKYGIYPIVAQAISTIIIVFISFIMHKFYSFSKRTNGIQTSS